MPSVQYNYDYYEYGKTRRGTRNVAPRVSDVQKNESSRAAIREKNRASIRAVMNEEIVETKRVPSKSRANATTTKTATKSKVSPNTANRKKVTSKDLDVPEMVNRKKPQVEKPQEMSLKKAEVVVSRKAKRKEKAMKRERFIKNSAFITFSFSILFLICYRSSVINEQFLAVNNVKSELETVNTLNAQIESEIQTQTDLSNIETYAKYQLGMQKPKESQIQKVVVKKEDKISTPIVIKEEETTFWDNILNDFLNILD